MMTFDCAVHAAQQARRVSGFALISVPAIVLPAPLLAKIVVFWQRGFPTVASQPVARPAVVKALDGMDAQIADLASLNQSVILSDADLLILPCK